ncbi:MAG TPA: SCO family protein [Thermoleophilaceae bacterium]
MRPRYAILIIVGTALAMAAVVVAARRAQRDSADINRPAPAARFAGAQLPPDLRAPSFALRDQDGRLVRSADLRGRPLVVTFLYTHCRDTCPVTAQQVKGALDRLRRPVPAIAVSVDPGNDDPASARAFLEKVGMRGRMRFLLGSRDQLAPVWRGYAIRPQGQHVEHQARLVLVDGRGVQRVGFPASQATPERLAHDLRALGAG